MRLFSFYNVGNPLGTLLRGRKWFNVWKYLKIHFYCGSGLNVPLMFYPHYDDALIAIQFSDVSWKDKYNTPRHEGSPFFMIKLFGLTLGWWFELPMDLWEQILWCLHYNGNKDNWPWLDMNDKSTWHDYL